MCFAAYGGEPAMLNAILFSNEILFLVAEVEQVYHGLEVHK
jgi:hypothetical protein